MIYGYARVSDESLTLETQMAELKLAGCEVIRAEKVSGKTREGRAELQIVLDFIREGDTLIVSKIDRLARNTIDVLTIITDLGRRGVKFKSLGEGWADTTTEAGMLVITIMAGVAQFERERIEKRRDAGIARARDNKEISEKTGRLKYAGRIPTLPRDKIRSMHADGVGPAKIARELKISRDSVYRVLKETPVEAAILPFKRA